MAKIKSVYVCQACGGMSAKWQGQCPNCEAWNSMEETVEDKPSTNRFQSLAKAAPKQRLAVIEAEDLPRISTGVDEFDRVLGGGLVTGGVALIGGDPGIGKSTLLLQALASMSARGDSVLYIS
ncbi:MAG: ATPase domain-containing protein, partial [Polynucleobacter victoriensis]